MGRTLCAVVLSVAVLGSIADFNAVSARAVVAARQAPSPAVAGFERLKSLAGEWIDVDGAFGQKGKVAARYRVIGAGSSVVEAFPIDTPQEMVTVYHLDGGSLALTHYCAGHNQPRMISKGLEGNSLTFDFNGGSNIDPAKTSHMHAARIEFVSADEIRSSWHNWANGKLNHTATLRLVRKK